MILDINLNDRTVISYHWGSDQRVPVVGEEITVGIDHYRVEKVTWVLYPTPAKGYVPVQRVILDVVDEVKS